MDIALKSDQEESIVALKRAIASRRNSGTTLIESQVHVSRTNAKVERAIGRWRSQFRRIKNHLGSQRQRLFELTHKMIPWMVSWAAEVIMKYDEGEDGQTRYERVTGHKARHKVLAFFKPATDT